MIVPASLFYRAGLNELDSVRLVASTYGFCALIIVVLMALKMYSHYIATSAHQGRNENLIASIILIFAFLPSHFVWSNLGLRESPTEFWLIAAFMSFFVIYHKKKFNILSLLMLTGSIALTFSARPQVGWVLGVSLIVYLLLNPRNTNTYFILPIVFSAVVLGSTLNLGSTLDTGSTRSTLWSIFNPLLDAGEIVEYKQEVNKLDAASIIETQSCLLETPALTSLLKKAC